MAISDLIRDIPNFPKDGIIFRDVTTLFGDPQGLSLVTTAFKELWLGSQIDYIAGIDARGFIVGGALAYELKAGFIPLRKKGNSHSTPFPKNIALNMVRQRWKCMLIAVAPVTRFS